MGRLRVFFWIMAIVAGVGIMLASGSISKENVNLPSVTSLLIKAPPERMSPGGSIDLEQIKIHDDSVEIRGIPTPILARLTDTNSMDPTFDSEATLLETPISDISQIRPGDIVSYTTKLNDGIIVHRVIEIGYDRDGWYARFKGDNLNAPDPELVRASQVQRKVLAIFY